MQQPMQQPGFGVPGQIPGQMVPGQVPGQMPGQQGVVPAGATPASFDPEAMTEGGGAPVQVNLTIKEASIVYYDYQGKAPQTVATRLVLVTDQGETLSPQYYSIGDPTKFMPSADGSQVMLLGGSSGINKSCNHGILMKGCQDAGFPKDQLGTGNIKVLEGLYAYWDGVTPPTRTGLATQPGQQQRRENIVSVPTIIHRLPGQQNNGQVPVQQVQQVVQAPVQPQPIQPQTQSIPVAAAPVHPVPVAPVAPMAPMAPPPQPQAPQMVQPAPAPVQAPGGVDLNAYAHGLATALGANFSLQQAMNLCYSQYPNEGFRDELATYIFSPEFSASLAQQGYQVQGHQVSR